MKIHHRTQFDSWKRWALVITAHSTRHHQYVFGFGTAMRWSFSGNRQSWAACVGPFAVCYVA